MTRSVTWTGFNHAATMSYKGATTAFKFDHTHRRIQETVTQGANVRTVYFVHPNNVGGLSYEREETKVGATVTRDESRHYISVGGAVVAVVKTLNGAGVVSSDNNLTQYWHKDALGSVVAVSNAAGVVQERMAFDAWGRRVRSTGLADAAVNPAHGDRGYTGHEHLDEQGLIHMNGRIAHPLLGRFLSSDPHVQDPNDLQNFNRYSYVLNNPLKYTDPSGEFWWYVAYAAGAALARNGNEYWQIVGVVLMAYSGVAAADGGAFGVAGATQTQSQTLATVAFGAVGGAASPGATSQDVVLGAIMAGALNVVGGTLTGESMMGQRVLAHAFLGCMQGMVSGGQCGPSAIAMAAGKAVTEGLAASGLDKYEGAAIAAVAGGAGAVIGGGKFANGAVQAGFGYLFNRLSTHRGDPGDAMSPESHPARGMSDTAGDRLGIKFFRAIPGVDLVGCAAGQCSGGQWLLAGVAAVPIGGGGLSVTGRAITLTELTSFAVAAKPVGQFGLQLSMVGRSATADLYSLAAAYGHTVGTMAQTAKGPVLGFSSGSVTIGLRAFSTQGQTTIQVTNGLGTGLKIRY